MQKDLLHYFTMSVLKEIDEHAEIKYSLLFGEYLQQSQLALDPCTKYIT